MTSDTTTTCSDACRRCGSPPSEDGLHGGSVCPPCGETEAKGTPAETPPPLSVRDRAVRATDAILALPIGRMPKPWRETVEGIVEKEIAAAVEDGCAYLKRVEDWARAGEVRAAEEAARREEREACLRAVEGIDVDEFDGCRGYRETAVRAIRKRSEEPHA